MNVLDLPGNPEARARGDLAERMVGKATDLALLVRAPGRASPGSGLQGASWRAPGRLPSAAA